jgi:hypothetical protein
MSLGKAGTRKYKKAMHNYVKKIPASPIPNLSKLESSEDKEGAHALKHSERYAYYAAMRNNMAPSNEVTPGSTARKAADIVSGSRQKTHGSAPEQFTDVAKRWQNHILLTHGIDVPLVHTDVGWMMADLKRSRAKYGEFNEDDYVDCIGYVDCVAQCIDR